MNNRCMGCPYLPLLLPHGWGLSSHFCGLESAEKNEVVEAS